MNDPAFSVGDRVRCWVKSPRPFLGVIVKVYPFNNLVPAERTLYWVHLDIGGDDWCYPTDMERIWNGLDEMLKIV